MAQQAIEEHGPVEMGGSAFLCDYPMTGREIVDTGIPNTISLGMRMGAAVRSPPSESTPIEALKRATGDELVIEFQNENLIASVNGDVIYLDTSCL